MAANSGESVVEAARKQAFRDGSGNTHSFNTEDSYNTQNSFNTNITNNYNSSPDAPATFEDLVASNRWGVLARQIDLDHLCDEHNWPEDGTGEWIFEDERYKKWQDSEGSELLWLCGGPGIGKTMLAKRVAAKFLRGHSDPREGVKLVFHFVSPDLPIDGIPADGAESPQPRLARVAWDLLYGILQQDGGLFDICRPEFQRQGDKLFTNQSSLWKILTKAIHYCPAGPVYILIDGLDGLGGDLCEELIGRILKLMDIRKVKIFLSGRDVPHISNNLREPTKINLDENGLVKEDVKTFIKRRVDRFGGWNADQKNGAIGALSAKSEGIFLWASLAIEHLKRFSSGPDYEEFLRKLPSKLINVYQKMLYDVTSREGSEKILQMIRNVALALRPLTFGEFGYILARIEGATGQQPSHKGTSTKIPRRTEMEIKQYVRSSLSFLRAGAETVSIVHHTAIEYLFDENRSGGDLPVLRKGEFDLRVSWECFQYLHNAFADLEKFLKEDGRGSHDKSRESSSRRDHPEEPAKTPQGVAQKRQQLAVDRWPYLRYAAESWFIHARRSVEIAEHEFCDDSDCGWLQYPFFGTRDTIRKPWIELCGDPKMEVLAGDQTPLHICAGLGLLPLVKKALSGPESGSTGIVKGQSPLHLAAKFRSGVFEILMAEGSQSLTASDQYGNTPLHEAAISGHMPMLVGLVEKFATREDGEYSDQINRRNHSGNTPLHLAIQFDHPDIVKFLVENDADVAIENNQGLTASKLGEELGREDSSEILERAEEIRGVGEIAEKSAEEARRKERREARREERREERRKARRKARRRKARREAKRKARAEARRGDTRDARREPRKDIRKGLWGRLKRLWRRLRQPPHSANMGPK
ncbi:hypothetical protein HOY82DRAFT_668812 [Tuber indicum]|nr:hypothetical protein HOY82DRAFT_668812 [Tuber indicum]